MTQCPALRRAALQPPGGCVLGGGAGFTLLHWQGRQLAEAVPLLQDKEEVPLGFLWFWVKEKGTRISGSQGPACAPLLRCEDEVGEGELAS